MKPAKPLSPPYYRRTSRFPLFSRYLFLLHNKTTRFSRY